MSISAVAWDGTEQTFPQHSTIGEIAMPDYHVTITASKDHETVERIVRAKNEARALTWVAGDSITISCISVDDLVRLTKAGVDIEVATDQP